MQINEWASRMFASTQSSTVAATMLRRMGQNVPKDLTGRACVDDATLRSITGVSKVPVAVQAAAASVADADGCRRLVGDRRVAVQVALIHNSRCPHDVAVNILATQFNATNSSDALMGAFHTVDVTVLASAVTEIHQFSSRFQTLVESLVQSCTRRVSDGQPLTQQQREAVGVIVDRVMETSAKDIVPHKMTATAHLVAQAVQCDAVALSALRRYVDERAPLFRANLLSYLASGSLTVEQFDVLTSDGTVVPRSGVSTGDRPPFSAVDTGVVAYVIDTYDAPTAASLLAWFKIDDMSADTVVDLIASSGSDLDRETFVSALAHSRYQPKHEEHVVHHHEFDRFVAACSDAGTLSADLVHTMLASTRFKCFVAWTTKSVTALLSVALPGDVNNWMCGSAQLSPPSSELLSALFRADPAAEKLVVDAVETRAVMNGSRSYSSERTFDVPTAALSELDPELFFSTYYANETWMAEMLTERFGAEGDVLAESLDMVFAMAETWKGTTRELLDAVEMLCVPPPVEPDPSPATEEPDVAEVAEQVLRLAQPATVWSQPKLFN